MKNKLTQHSLFQSLEHAISTIPDHRSLNHTTHSMRDAIFVSFSGFFLQARSLKGYINFLKKSKASKNKKALFNIHTIPTDNQVRNIIDPIPTTHFEEAQDDIIFKMQRSGVLKEFKKTIKSKSQPIEMGHLVGLDGIEYFRSKKILCYLLSSSSQGWDNRLFPQGIIRWPHSSSSRFVSTYYARVH